MSLGRLRRICPTWRRNPWTALIAGLILLPILLFSACEGLLRLLDYGSPTRFFIPIPDQPARMANPRFAWQFFPRGLAQEPVLTRLPNTKADDTIRIFVFGASVAAGVPDVAFSFSRILETMLAEAYPTQRFEVVNTAVTAINSHVVRRIADEALELAPDLFIVYLGHTEMIGPYGVAGALGNKPASTLAIQADLAWRRTRTGQWGEAIAERLRGQAGWQRWRGMEMFAAAHIHPEDRRLRSGYRHFETNLRHLCRSAASRGVRVILCTPASNLVDCPPFASELRPRLGRRQREAWQVQYDLGRDFEREDLREEALQSYLRALAIDDTHAELRFRIARTLDALGRGPEAHPHYRAARDADALRFRADTRTLDILRTIAADTDNTHLLDLEQELSAASVAGLPGADFFYEHAHFHYEGNYTVARLLFDQTAAALKHRGLTPAKTPPDASGCARRLALTGWNRFRMAEEMLRIVERPPFTAQLEHDQTLAAQRQVLQRLNAHTTPERLDEALKQYRATLRRRPEDLLMRVNDARLALRANQPERAITQWELLLQRLPQQPNLHYNLGTTLARIGRLQPAAEQLEQAIALNPYDPRAYNNLGNLAYAGGDAPAARRRFRQAIRRDPLFAEAHNNLGAVLAAGGRHQEAIRAYRQAIALQPGYADAYNNLGSTLYVSGHLAEGRTAFEEALLLRPSYADARLNLARAFYKERDLMAALPHFQWLARQQPTDPLTHFELGAAYAGLNRIEEARAAFSQALILKPDWTAAKAALQQLHAGP